jgi:hypothetical protein
MIVEIDGDLYDEETGEYAGPASRYIDGAADTEEKVLQVMRKHMDLVADIEATKIKHEAILANIKVEMARKESRLDWLLRQYQADLEHYVHQTLPRDKEGNLKTKTWSCPWGKISFRTTIKRKTISDQEAYVKWCVENNRLDLLKLTPMIQTIPDDAPYTESVGGDERMSIKIK